MSHETMGRAQVGGYASIDAHDHYAKKDAEKKIKRAEAKAKAAFKTEFPGTGKHFAKLRALAERLKTEAGF